MVWQDCFFQLFANGSICDALTGKKYVRCAGGICGAVALKFWCSGKCAKIFPRCYAAYKAVTTCIKLICKSLIYAVGALKFSAQSPNYAGVLDEIVYFFQSAVSPATSNPSLMSCVCFLLFLFISTSSAFYGEGTCTLTSKLSRIARYNCHQHSVVVKDKPRLQHVALS